MYRMLTIFMFCLAATWSVSAQTAPVPDKYEIETAADCARYNDDVLRCAEWLRTTPYDPTKSGEWLRVAGFLTRWSAGTDEVMYEISEETAPVLGADLGVEKMSLLFSAYLAGGAESVREYSSGGGVPCGPPRVTETAGVLRPVVPVRSHRSFPNCPNDRSNYSKRFSSYLNQTFLFHCKSTGSRVGSKNR